MENQFLAFYLTALPAGFCFVLLIVESLRLFLGRERVCPAPLTVILWTLASLSCFCAVFASSALRTSPLGPPDVAATELIAAASFSYELLAAITTLGFCMTTALFMFANKFTSFRKPAEVMIWLTALLTVGLSLRCVYLDTAVRNNALSTVPMLPSDVPPGQLPPEQLPIDDLIDESILGEDAETP